MQYNNDEQVVPNSPLDNEDEQMEDKNDIHQMEDEIPDTHRGF